MDRDEIDDFLTSGYWDISPDRTRTRRACAEILRRLPPDIVEEIVCLQSVILLAPGKGDLGLARPMSVLGKHNDVPQPPHVHIKEGQGSKEKTYTPEPLPEFKFGLVYLSPELEERPVPVLMAVIAHEVAHIATRNIIGDESERQADDLIREWGFGLELEELRKANPRHRY